ncbi:hypothetical protein HanPSC8_Chr11g0452741 [Helianthus annuus]|nr:hypothetical protein HanPSC8_Chr11g0452741 [Helianthus annuus]
MSFSATPNYLSSSDVLGGGGSGERRSHRLSLSDVVSNCLRRWVKKRKGFTDCG